eukprot:Transcript_29258.p1 GENE.Transcript_29258~~Transcript_29258.p1  ORF type:complete len:492 (+),score=195.44 Transcript_29258:105-1580(+)
MSSEQQDLADLLQKKHSLIEAKSHAAERGDLLGEIHQKVKRVHSSPTSFAQALALLRELSGDLKGKADGASVELLSRAVGLLHKWRMGTGNPTEVAIKAMLAEASTKEAEGLRAWIPETFDEADAHAAPIPVGRFRSVAREVPLHERVLHPAVKPQMSDAEAELGQMLEHGVLAWEFDVLRLSELTGGHPLLALGWALFERHQLRDELGLRSEQVLSFLSQVEARYLPVPYHNAEHACDVTHAMHYLINSEALRPLAATPLDMLACLIAALCHDVGHDGRNNAFHQNTQSALARRHAYQAPLERHHLATTFDLLDPEKPDTNILAPLERTQARQVRDKVVSLILATDFGVHKQILDAANEMADKHASGEHGSDDMPGDAMLGLKMAIKLADLSYLSKGDRYVQVWTDRVLDEFFAQGDAEKALIADGVLDKVSMGMDRENHVRPNSQIGFISFMVMPLYEAMARLAPIPQPLDNLKGVLDGYKAQVAPAGP